MEVAVGALALVPLVLLVIWLGKIQSIQQAGIAASRALAFECTVRPDDCSNASAHPELADEIRRRVFSRVDVPLLTLDRVSGTMSAADRNPLWVDRANRPLIERFSDIGARIDVESFDAGQAVAKARAGTLAADPASLLDGLAGPGRFGLDSQGGLVNARIQVGVSSSARADGFRAQLDAIPLRVKANTAVLTDAWNAWGPYGDDSRSVESRVGQGRRLLGVYESSLDVRYALTRGAIALMGAIGLEPAADDFRYHEIDVDLVPSDRIGTAEAAR